MALSDYSDFASSTRRRYLEYLDPTLAASEEGDATRPARFAPRGNALAKQQALADVTPQSYGVVRRLGTGLLNDVKGIGETLGALGAAPVAEAYRLAFHPAERVAQYKQFATSVAEDPLGSVTRASRAIGAGLVEPWMPKEGERPLDVVTRNLLDRPLGTMFDAAAIVGGPAELLSHVGVPGAAAVARGVAAADPISLTRNLLTSPLAETVAPGAVARIKASRMLADSMSEQTARLQAAHVEFAGKTKEVFAGLDDAEKALFFPYVEGRLKAMSPESGMAGQVGELTPQGTWQPRAIDPSRLQRLEGARQAYLPLLDELETRLGYRPEQAAIEGGLRAQRDVVKNGFTTSTGEQVFDPLHPEAVAHIQNEADSWQQRAADAQLARRTVSTRTALDVKKVTDFQAELAKIRLEQGADAAAEYARQYPVQPTTPEEALAVMGPQGGLYFPHSGEVATRDQSTIGNTLIKVRESVPWKQNSGALFRTGALEGMDPEKALINTYLKTRRATGIQEVYDSIGRTLGEQLSKGHPFGTDPDLRAGTHQILKPGLVHQEGALGEIIQDLQQHLLDAAGTDPAAGAVNMMDVAERASSRIDSTLPLRNDAPVYKIPKSVGDALKAFQRSFEPATNPMAQWLDATADPFHFVTLNLRPARILNNATGNTLFQVMQGIHPFSSRGLGAIADMARAVTYKTLGVGGPEAAKLARIYDVAGVATGGLEGSIDASRTARALREHGGPLGRGLAKGSNYLQTFNQHVENTARALSSFFELRKEAPSFWSRALGSAQHVISLGDRIEGLAAAGEHALDDPGWREALGQVNNFLNDYTRATPAERTFWRRLFPYEKFYRHAAGLALRFPFEHPTRATLLRGIGTAALNDARENLHTLGFDWHTMVRPDMQDSIPVDVRNDPVRGKQVLMLNTRGPNPFSLLSGSDPGVEALGALHPLVKTAIEWATGLNLYKMERFKGANTTYNGKEVDPHTGQMVDSIVRPGPISLFARQFFPVQIARELLAGDRVPLDDASIRNMVMASVTGNEGYAYKVDDRGLPIRRPKGSPFLHLLGPTTQVLEAPTKAEAQSSGADVSAAYNALGRDFPALRQQLRDAYAKRRREEADSGFRRLPFRHK